jgi:hypothetical protein
MRVVFVTTLAADRSVKTTEIALRRRKSLTLISYMQQDANTQGKNYKRESNEQHTQIYEHQKEITQLQCKNN